LSILFGRGRGGEIDDRLPQFKLQAMRHFLLAGWLASGMAFAQNGAAPAPVDLSDLPSAETEPKLPGLGDVNWGQFFSVLSDTGYNGPICVEVEDRAYEGSLENRKASLVQAHGYLRQFMGPDR